MYDGYLITPEMYSWATAKTGTELDPRRFAYIAERRDAED
jgi:hypothetical protein